MQRVVAQGVAATFLPRIGAVLAGLPKSVGGITVNRFCASGLAAVAMAADRIRVGEADVMIAAGTESMSMVPMMGNSPSLSPSIFGNTDNVDDYGIAYGMGLTAEKVAQQWKVSREAQDAFAVQSHQRALAAMQAGEFKDEITPITVTERPGDDGQPRYLLVCGEGRLNAFRILGETHIPALVVDVSDEDAFIMSLAENIARRGYRPLEILADILIRPAFNQDKLDLARLEAESAIQRRNDNVAQITTADLEIHGQKRHVVMQIGRASCREGV